MILTAQGRFLLLTGLGLLLLSLLTACTPRVFGIPEERWQQLTEEQRLEAIRGYNERELLRQQQSLARQQQAAADAKRRAIEEEREAQRQQERVAAIYAGQGTVPGDLIRVTLREGRLRFNGKQEHYRPTSFMIADGETKGVVIQSTGGKRQQQTTLWVRYREGNLDIDVGPDCRNQGHAVRLTYERAWERGETYRDLSWDKHSPTQGEHVSITILTACEGERPSHKRH